MSTVFILLFGTPGPHLFSALALTQDIWLKEIFAKLDLLSRQQVWNTEGKATYFFYKTNILTCKAYYYNSFHIYVPHWTFMQPDFLK